MSTKSSTSALLPNDITVSYSGPSVVNPVSSSRVGSLHANAHCEHVPFLYLCSTTACPPMSPTCSYWRSWKYRVGSAPTALA